MPITIADLESIARKYIHAGYGDCSHLVFFQAPDSPGFAFATRRAPVDEPALVKIMVQALEEAATLAVDTKKEDTMSFKQNLEIATAEVAFDNGYLAAVQSLAEKIGLSKDGTKDQVYLRILDFFYDVEDQKGDIAKEAHANGVNEARENIRLELQRRRDKSIKQAAEAKAAGERLVLEAKEAVEKSAWLAEEASTYDSLLSNMI